MKHKYQSSLSRRLAASGLAAVFGTGAFSSYVGAMKEMDPNLVQQPYLMVLMDTKILKLICQ